ncbi:hypothetical protein GZL_04243 [Streptomyces sp. 769]|nr:hypothetical protein GZL_04243 [Streptomyces sp. 769]
MAGRLLDQTTRREHPPPPLRPDPVRPPAREDMIRMAIAHARQRAEVRRDLIARGDELDA